MCFQSFELLCDYYNVPLKKDLLNKLIQQQISRNNSNFNVDVLSRIAEILGFETQLGQCDVQNLSHVQAPALLLMNDKVHILWGNQRGLILGNPTEGNFVVKQAEIQNSFDPNVRFALIKKSSITPTSRFGWSWFLPLIDQYKKSLSLVFICSLLAQLFALAIPLLIQQIIDKVLAQGNLSSLNILGATMIILALFQGILQVLRTYVFVDTTDRLDLALGSSVITRLLSLPLSYFEKRPVGELSQRLGELNSIRGFLTGTALISVLNIIFALMYLVIMFMYSPLECCSSFDCTCIHFNDSRDCPYLQNLIRKRAVAQARTQSHLIEIIGGIQTVKAQNFEIQARWKWQERYRKMVDEGFKTVALGSASGEFGSFLTQFSSLVVLWFGIGLVLQGELSLGQLIAFRIISGMVINPLLQLAGLYQGFQSVQLSMERLSISLINHRNSK